MVKKSNKISSEDKKAVKTTIVMVVLAGLIAGAFLFFHRNKTVKTTKVQYTHKKLPVAQKPIPSDQKSEQNQLKGISSVFGAKKFKIAFILDDWGYRMGNCHYLKSIKAPLAISVLPDLPHSNDIMKCASLYDKDIMLHLPLEPYYTADHYPDYYLITTKMPQAKVASLLDNTFRKMPLIVGVNNHMGSKATENKELMEFIFKKIKKRGLFFVDSMTAPHHSICATVADDMKLPFAKRDIFLDNVNTREAIERQMIDLVQRARQQGYAIAIGHDRQLTLQILQEDIPVLQKQGFEIVHVKDLLRNIHNQ